MPTMTKRILVTGGAGFLGSHLCDRSPKVDLEAGLEKTIGYFRGTLLA